MEAQSKSRGQMMPYKCRRYSIRLHQFAKIGANGCVLSVNLSQRSACWERCKLHRKARGISQKPDDLISRSVGHWSGIM
jgi:wyosine [tRNA(Phe)-imidazoG37] synthetase (radical SAM superfamily)